MRQRRGCCSRDAKYVFGEVIVKRVVCNVGLSSKVCKFPTMDKQPYGISYSMSVNICTRLGIRSSHNGSACHGPQCSILSVWWKGSEPRRHILRIDLSELPYVAGEPWLYFQLTCKQSTTRTTTRSMVAFNDASSS